MTPDAPGWWWRDVRDDTQPVLVVAFNGAREMPRGHDLVWYDSTPDPFGDGEALGWAGVTDDGRWLGPVAPPGSIPPAEHAREVRVWWTILRGCDLEHAARLWRISDTRRHLIATLTRHGTPQPEAERLADGAQETTP